MGGAPLTLLTVLGFGLIVVEADKDAGAVSAYVPAGTQYGTYLLWLLWLLLLLLLLLPICYFVQEMVVRLGIATGQSDAAISVILLFVLSFLLAAPVAVPRLFTN